MFLRSLQKIVVLSALLLGGLNAFGQEKPSPILFIYDASGSMWGKIGDKTKIQIAGEVLKSVVSGMDTNQAFGIIMYR